MPEDSNTIVITVERFKADFPEFNDYPDSSVSGAILEATFFISNKISCILDKEIRGRLIELAAAHLLTINNYSAMNGGMGQMLQASVRVGNVSVANAIPEQNSQSYNFWATTGYGLRYWNILTAHKGAGAYIGGSFQRKFKDNIL